MNPAQLERLAINPAVWQWTSLLCGLLWAVAAGIVTYQLLKAVSRFKPEARDYKVNVPLLFKLFLPLAPTFFPLLRRPAAAKAVERANGKLVQAGMEQSLTGEEFLALRLMYALVFIPLGGLFMLAGSKLFFLFGFFIAVFLGLVYPSMWLHSTIRQRHRSIQRALPSVLDLLTLSVEAGRDFLTALKDILQHRRQDPLGEELERVFREVQLGKARRQALRNMAARVRQPDLVSVVETLVQADELGVSIGHILRILGDQMRQKRFAHAEKLANESPVKMLLPLFLFIFPAVLIIVLGPVLLRALGNFL